MKRMHINGLSINLQSQGVKVNRIFIDDTSKTNILRYVSFTFSSIITFLGPALRVIESSTH